ncbi:Hpt domain-containing protein [Shewanella surugensis]|uniref:Hpt domain-containing protein n=1 Tax=Shewanella surugensis TaxID=212020 RepID=A0ABT0L989_9GAMM|nr:Hpt domain-containing protein [Shewanella surugensis]MCL1124267.1 Hpt domain-containing protein [Shewanella surugensis]
MEHYQQFLDTLDNDTDMVNIILNMYKEEHGEDIIKIKSCYENNNLDELFHLTHSLKGVISNFFEQDICDLLEKIENTSKSGETPPSDIIESACDKIEDLNNQIDKIIMS